MSEPCQPYPTPAFSVPHVIGGSAANDGLVGDKTVNWVELVVV
jgi:hypothetical protein